MADSSEEYISNLLISTFVALESAGIKTCILSGYEAYPDHIPSDVDFVVLPEDLPKIPAILFELPCLLLQCLQHESNAYYYVLCTTARNGTPCFLHLDVSGDFRRDGRVFLTAEEIIASRREYNNFWVPSPDIEFAYYLIKKIAKRSINEQQRDSLVSLYQQDPDGCKNQIRRFWSAEAARKLVSVIQLNKWSTVDTEIAWFRKNFLIKAFKRKPSVTLAYWKDDVLRRVRRVCIPTGLHVVIFGTDGSGKSSVLEKIKTTLAPAFRRTLLLHLRPAFLKTRGSSGPVINPHRLANYSFFMSLLKLGHFSLDYVIGYFAKIYPKLVRSTLVLFDRYYHDIIVDPRRYRYGGPMGLARLVGKIIPKPDLFILLDAPPEVLQSRKKEVPFEETARQREAYLDLIRRMKNGVVVDASRPLDDVIAEVTGVILAFMAKRTRERFER
ncbi:MAG: thymidylate kinase-like protein [Deltaproteobacteria bacterium]|nr:thymidylate kinase-like protein [Deltaproteobacteria bacterium]